MSEFRPQVLKIEIKEEPHDDTVPSQPLPLQSVMICETCDLKFKDYVTYREHVKNHESNHKPLPAQVPRLKSFFKEPLRPSKIPFKTCRVCLKSCVSEEDLAIHENKHRNDKALTCQICSKVMLSKFSLIEHEKTHLGQTSIASKPNNDIKPHRKKGSYDFGPCKRCGRKFMLKGAFQMHQRKIMCQVPYGELPRRSLLQLLDDKKCDREKNEWRCAHCDFQALNRRSMVEHVDVHRQRPKRFYCYGHCSQSFSAKQGLERHWKNTRNNEEQECQICKAKFLKPSQLRTHLRTHGRYFHFQISEKAALHGLAGWKNSLL